MPELPEVETVCRLMRKTLKGRKISGVEAFSDHIVFKGASPDEIQRALLHKTVSEIGRKGKYFWVSFAGADTLMGHLGMSGWVERLEPEQETPKFAKLRLDVGDQGSLVFTDARRLGRLWLASNPQQDPSIKALGLDAYCELPSRTKFHELVVCRKAPIKAVLLNQKILSGIGNYLADEVLYQARIAPHREAGSLSTSETSKLRNAISHVVGLAVDVGADEDKFPDTWLFRHRWGGKRGPGFIGKNPIQRETVAGRTTAWVPRVQH